MLYRAATSPNAAFAATLTIHQTKSYKTRPLLLRLKDQSHIPSHISSISQNNQTQPSITQTSFVTPTEVCQISTSSIPNKATVISSLSRSRTNNILNQITNNIPGNDSGLTQRTCRYLPCSRGAFLARSTMRSRQSPVVGLTVKMTAKRLV